MTIYHELPREKPARPTVLAIGFFDGVHRGHREILRALQRLRKPGERAAVLTFRNHPATFLRPEHAPSLITTVEERVSLLAAAGVDDLYLLPFDGNIASLDAQTFVHEVLLTRLSIRALAVGENFRFGAKRGGDVALATHLLRPHGIEVVAIPPLVDGESRVSSTRIREALARGDVAAADALLGTPYELRGTVLLGTGRGHGLGFPTANLAVPPAKTLPMDGVYTVVGRYDGRDHKGLVSIGDNPTFGAGPKTVEAWLLDFDQTIYGQELALREFRFVREQRRFANTDELIEAMRHDATFVRFPSFAG